MKNTGLKCIALFLLVSTSCFSQPEFFETPREANTRNEMLLKTISGGFYAPSLAALVDSSIVIVRGRYGAALDRWLNYGEGVTKAGMMERTGESEEDVEIFYGLPMVNYEIHIEEVIKGQGVLDGASELIIQMLESPDAKEVFTWLNEFREGEHLFFLYRNLLYHTLYGCQLILAGKGHKNSASTDS